MVFEHVVKEPRFRYYRKLLKRWYYREIDIFQQKMPFGVWKWAGHFLRIQSEAMSRAPSFVTCKTPGELLKVCKGMFHSAMGNGVFSEPKKNMIKAWGMGGDATNSPKLNISFGWNYDLESTGCWWEMSLMKIFVCFSVSATWNRQVFNFSQVNWNIPLSVFLDAWGCFAESCWFPPTMALLEEWTSGPENSKTSWPQTRNKNHSKSFELTWAVNSGCLGMFGLYLGSYDPIAECQNEWFNWSFTTGLGMMDGIQH